MGDNVNGKPIKLYVILKGARLIQGTMSIFFCQMFRGLRLFKGVCLFRSLEYTGDANSQDLLYVGDIVNGKIFTGWVMLG